MSSELDNTDKIVVFIEECREMKLDYKLPSVNEGEYMFTVNDRGEIVYGLGAIKGLGEGPVENIIAARNSGGPFKNLFDFCERTDPRKVNKRAIEALIRSGAFDDLGEDRAVLMAAMPEAVQVAEQAARNSEIGMVDLFGDTLAVDNRDVYEPYRDARRWTTKERLQGRKGYTRPVCDRASHRRLRGGATPVCASTYCRAESRQTGSDRCRPSW